MRSSSVFLGLPLCLAEACVTTRIAPAPAPGFAAFDGTVPTSVQQFPDEALKQERPGFPLVVDHDRCQPGGTAPDWRVSVPAAELGGTAPLAPTLHGVTPAPAELLARYDCQPR